MISHAFPDVSKTCPLETLPRWSREDPKSGTFVRQDVQSHHREEDDGKTALTRENQPHSLTLHACCQEPPASNHILLEGCHRCGLIHFHNIHVKVGACSWHALMLFDLLMGS
jgi:hypothetical protein